MWKQLNRRGAPLTSGRSSSQKRKYKNERYLKMVRVQYTEHQRKLQEEKIRLQEEKINEHIDRCKKLNLPITATPDECKNLEEIKIEQENLEKEILEIRLENERLENERLENERLEKIRLENERLEKIRLENERLENERLEKIRLENERLEKIRLENERLVEMEKEREKIKKLKLELERAKAESKKQKKRHEKERIERERVEKERVERERVEKERAEREREILKKKNNEYMKMLFKPTSTLGTKIFIFNGETPNLRNASIYGKKYIDQVIKHFPNTEIIWSSMTNVPYHKLSEIYNQVAIGLCLTEQKHEVAGLKEMNFMNIPIIHNHSIFGLKWKNVDDIMNIIKKKINLIHEVCPISQIRHKKILINSHSYLNDNAGDTIMVSNYMNLLMRDNNHITLITKYKCPDFIRNLIYKKYTIVITGDDTKNIMNAIDRYMYSVDYALIRNHEVLEEMKSKPYLNRVIFYGLDCHMDGLKKMNNEFHYIITQSELLKKKLVKNNIDSEKIYIVQPIVFKYDFNLPKKNDNEIRLVYCGTLRDEENILEIIEEFQKIHKKRPEVVLKIVYGKIHGDVTFTRKVNEYIKNGVKGITFKHNLSHKDACYEIATSDIGICWRKNGWGDNGEVSTKVREYKMYGLDIIRNIDNFDSVCKREVACNNCNTKKIFNLSNKCVVISKCLKHFTKQYYNSHNPYKYNVNSDCVFFGIYNVEDCMNLINHEGKKYILWGGTDLRFVTSIKKYYPHIFHKNVIHLAISKFIVNKLFNFTNNIINLKFELIDNANISSFNEKIKKELIYIYTANDERRAKMTYGYDLYNPIVNHFTDEKFLIANNKSYKYSQMKKIYSNVKLGLRLTYFDGNANTVQELSTNGIYSLNNSDVIGSIPYIEDVELLKHQVSYLLKNLTIPDKKLYVSSQIEKQNKYFIYNNKSKYDIYILYTDKPFLNDNIGGAAINEINKISTLIQNNNVYYNNIFINDCFDENNNYIYENFLKKYKEEIKVNKNRIDFYTDKWNNNPLFYPSNDYDFVFYRAPGNIEIYEKIFELLPEPKIWSHSYNKRIWGKNIIGFQTETASILADMKYLQNYNTDGTINYQKDMITPKRKNFILYQSVREKTTIIEKLNLKSKYNTKFILGIIGTIYKYTYPWSHLKIIDKLRNKYPKLNIQLIILSHTISEEIPKKDHIHFINSPKHLIPSYLNEIDVILDTWNNEQIIFGGSNKLIDCIVNEIPVITAKTFSHIELLGKGYKLMHLFLATEKYFSNNIENDIQNKIEYCMNANNYNSIKKYLSDIKYKHNYDVVSQKYNIQFNKFYNKSILIICPDIFVGGVVTYTLNMIKSLKRFNLYLCIENKSNISEKYYNSIKSFIKELTYDEMINTNLYFDTVICNSSPIQLNQESDNIMSKLNTITSNLIYITHNDVAAANPFLKKYNQFLDKVITVNNLTITKLSKNFNMDESKFYCIPPCSDFIHDIQPKTKINKIIGYFGRVNDIKQPKFLIKCFDKIIEQFPDWKLYIVGPSIKPWNINDIKKNIQNAKNKDLLERNVVIVDKNIEDEEEKRRYYKLFDILVSTTTIEGFPFVVSESLRMGTPVIITNVGGNKDCIKSGYNGDILNFKGLYTDQIYDDNIYIKLINQMYENEQYNFNEFKKVITQYLKSPKKILEMSKNALETIKYKYNNIQFKNKLFKII